MLGLGLGLSPSGFRDRLAPTITSNNTASVQENATLSHSLTANETVTWSIVGGADQAQFEISGSTLRWSSNGTQDFEDPADADTDNDYVVQVRATDGAGNTTDQTITVTVTDVADTSPTYVGGKVAVFAGTTSNTDIALTDLAGGLASQPSQNDIIVLAYCTGSNINRDLTVNTADYNELADLYADDTNDTNLAVFWKRAGASPDETVQVGPTGGSADAGAVAIQVWRGVNVTTAIDVATTTATGIDTGRPDPPAITPTTTGAVVIVCAGAATTVGAIFAQSGSELSNFITNTSPDSFDATVGMGSFEWSSGEFNPTAWVGSTTGTGDSWAAVTLALRPA